MKQKNNKGFTLGELLIVVAIISVLVAIAIPIFNGSLRKARLATDQANVRSAKAAAAAEYMSDGESGEVSYLYDGSKAIKLSATSSASTYSSISGYGKSDGKDNQNSETGASGTPKDGYVEVNIDNGNISALWVSNFAISGDSQDIKIGNTTLKGNALSGKSLEEQLKKEGLSKKDVIVFTADDNTYLADSQLKNGGTLTDMFAGYENLKVIDLSKATMVNGNINLFQDIPDSVDKIVLPKIPNNSNGKYNYDIRGTWYFAGGERLSPDIIKGQKGSGAVDGDSRVLEKDAGKTIYRSQAAAKAAAGNSN